MRHYLLASATDVGDTGGRFSIGVDGIAVEDNCGPFLLSAEAPA